MSRSRREFLEAGPLCVATALRGQYSHTSAPSEMPRRKLGRTGVEVGVIGMGLAPLGLGGYSPKEFEATATAAVDAGIDYFDVQPDYGRAESWFAPVLRRYRDRVFVATKTWETTRDKVLDSLDASLKRLGIASVDAVFLNNIGGYDLDRLFKPDGALAALRELRRRGKTRFLGVSGHMREKHFVKTLETGEFDIVMAPFNFVDRHIYGFERDILPVAEKHEVGVVAMKVLGGAVGLNYATREQKARLGPEEHERAIRFVLGLHGMCSAVIGCKNNAEVRLAAECGRNYRPLDSNEIAALNADGKRNWRRNGAATIPRAN